MQFPWISNLKYNKVPITKVVYVLLLKHFFFATTKLVTLKLQGGYPRKSKS